MPWTNYHSHTDFCDGKYPPASYANEARRQGFAAYGFSSHAPLPFACAWCMERQAVSEYFADIQILKAKLPGRMQLYRGLEVDYIPAVAGPQSPFIRDLDLDYSIGSVHFVEAFADGIRWEVDGPHPQFLRGLHGIFGNDIRRAVTRYYELIRQMVVEEKPDVVGHLDKIKIQNQSAPLFDERDDWYREAVAETLRTIAGSGLVMEVNTRGLYKKRAAETYPSRWILEQAHRMGIAVTLSSDAHHPREIAGCFAETAQMLREIGYRTLQILWNGTWQPAAFNENGVENSFFSP